MKSIRNVFTPLVVLGYSPRCERDLHPTGKGAFMLSVCAVSSTDMNQLEFCILFWAVVLIAGEDQALRRS